MLRPAYLPPSERRLPRSGLSTLRFGPRDFSGGREPATRRVAAYRGGTFTHWIITARRRVRPPFVGTGSVVVATHHRANLASRRGVYSRRGVTRRLAAPARSALRRRRRAGPLDTVAVADRGRRLAARRRLDGRA